MRYLTVLFAIIVVLIGGFLTYDWNRKRVAASEAFAIAKQRIEDAAARGGVEKLDLSDLAGLQVIPEEIASLENLSSLRLSNTGVGDLRAVANLPLLNTLDLKNTRISDLNPLTGSARLERLVLASSWAFDLSPLAEIETLRELNLSNTAVESLAPLGELVALETLNLYSSYAHDGSRDHYQALQAGGVRVISGNAYQRNYVPGIPYRVQMSLARLASRYAPDYAAARELVVSLRGARKKQAEAGYVCITNNAGTTLYFTIAAEEQNTHHADLPHNSWTCVRDYKRANLGLSLTKHGQAFCSVSTQLGSAYNLTGYNAKDGCIWQ